MKKFILSLILLSSICSAQVDSARILQTKRENVLLKIYESGYFKLAEKDIMRYADLWHSDKLNDREYLCLLQGQLDLIRMKQLSNLKKKKK